MLKLPLTGAQVPRLVDATTGFAAKAAVAWALYVLVIEICLPRALRAAVRLGVLDEKKLRFPLDFWFPPPERPRKPRRNKPSPPPAGCGGGGPDQAAEERGGREIRAAIAAVSAMEQSRTEDDGPPRSAAQEQKSSSRANSPSEVELGSIGPPPVSDSALRDWFVRNNPLAACREEEEEMYPSSTGLGPEASAKLEGYLQRAKQVLPPGDHDELSRIFASFRSREVDFAGFVKQTVRFLIARENWSLLGLLQLLPESDSQLRTVHRLIEEYRQSPQGLLDCATMPMLQDIKALVFVLASPRHTHCIKARALRQLHDLMAGPLEGDAEAEMSVRKRHAEDFRNCGGPELMVLLAERHRAFREIIMRILLAEMDSERCASG